MLSRRKNLFVALLDNSPDLSTMTPCSLNVVIAVGETICKITRTFFRSRDIKEEWAKFPEAIDESDFSVRFRTH